MISLCSHKIRAFTIHFICEYIGIRLTGYEKKKLITEILKITVRLTGYGFTALVCMYVCMCACMYECSKVCMLVCTYLCMYACICMYMHICMYVCTYVRTYAYVYMYIEKFVMTFWHTKFFCYVDKILYVFPIIIITSCSHLNSYHVAQFFQEGIFMNL